MASAAQRLGARHIARDAVAAWRRADSRAAHSSTRRRSDWKKQVQEAPSLREFLQTARDRVNEDAIVSETHALTREESLGTIHRILEEIRGRETDQTTVAPRALVDTFGRAHTYLRISLTERCNLRCRYCMPAEGVDLQPQDDLLTTTEIVRLARLFADCGVTRVRLTGGEPLLRPDLVDLVAQLRGIPGINSVGVTTNGIVLQKKLRALQDAGVDRLNISLDTLHADKFAQITRRQGFSRVMGAINDAQMLGFAPLKINCVVMRDFNLLELLDFVEFTRTNAVDVRFIEWMPFDSNKWNDTTFVSFKEMMSIIESRYAVVEKLDDDANDTSKAFRIPGFKGQFGFITSMSQHFCGTCNRLRLTADGNLKVCLFGNTEVSLRDAMRHDISDRDIQSIVDVAVKRKKFALGGHRDMYGISKAKNRPMILIGG